MKAAKVVLHKMRSDWYEQRRYPVQLFFGILTTTAMLWGLGLAVASVSQRNLAGGALASFIGVAAALILYSVPRLLTGGEDHPPEELMLFPIRLSKLVGTLTVAFVAQIVFGMLVLYSVATWVSGQHGIDFIKVASALLLGAASAAGLGFIVYALKLVYRKVEGFAGLIQMGLFGLAFVPPENLMHLPRWVSDLLAWIPLVGVMRWISNVNISPVFLCAVAAVWMVVGIIGIELAERVVVRRGIAAQG